MHAAARDVSARLSNIERIRAASQLAVQQSAFPITVYWQPCSIAGGNAGMAVLFAYLDACFPAENWDRLGHEHLSLAIDAMKEQREIPLGLFTGVAGLAFATWSLSHAGKRYRKLLTTLETLLFSRVPHYLSALLEQEHGVAVEQYDLISGLTGIGSYLLCRRDDPAGRALLEDVLTGIMTLTQEQEGRLRCNTPSRYISTPEMHSSFPDGYINCGLAHGVPGPLALLALAKLHGVEVSGIDGAIEHLANWLIVHHMQDEWGINWPVGIPLHASDTTPVQSSRSAWCYGAPGIARALWLAGNALHDTRYGGVAVAAMQAIYSRSIAARRIDTPVFCHGVAGLLHITLRFAQETEDQLFVDAANTLAEQLLSFYEPETLLGYRDQDLDGTRLDIPAFLRGVAGIAAVLFAASTTVPPAWDRLFLLS